MDGPPNPETMRASDITSWWMDNHPLIWEAYVNETSAEAVRAVEDSFAARSQAILRG